MMSSYLLWGFCLVLLVALVLLATTFWRQLQQLRLSQTEQLRQQQQWLNELQGINQSNLGMGRRIHLLEKNLRQLIERIEDSQRQAASENKSFLSANRLFEQGASTEQVMAACQLTRAEAELVRNIQQQKN